MTMTKKLIISLIVTFAVLIGEIVGGILSDSLALLSDAGHVLTDVFSLCMSLLALMIMKGRRWEKEKLLLPIRLKNKQN